MFESSICAGVKRGAAATGAAIRARSMSDAAAAAVMPASINASQRNLFDIVILHAPCAPAAIRSGHARASRRWQEIGEGVRVTSRIGNVVGAQREREVVTYLVRRI